MKPKKKKTSTIVRKKSQSNRKVGDDLTKSTSVTKKVQAMVMFTNGKTYKEISATLGWTEASIRTEILKLFNALKILISTENLVKSQELDAKGVNGSTQAMTLYSGQKKIDADINADFLSKLSGEKDSVLTQEEMLFCYLLVHEGDEMKALTNSGLASGLKKSNPSWKRASKLRLLMLKGKKNLIRYTSNLQVQYAREANVNKEAIQSMLMRQIAQLESQNNPRNAPTISKLTENLGRTVGAFSDKITVEEVSFDDAMDKMLEMRKVNGKDKTVDTSDPKTFVYDPERIG